MNDGADEGDKSKVSDTEKAKLPGEGKEEEKVEEDFTDFTLLDSLLDFLNNDEELLPILCGYFNKIVQSLLTKNKHSTLEYLLLKRKGTVFDGLLRNIQHHSLAILMIELLCVKIEPLFEKKEERQRMAWDASDGSDNENTEDPTAEGELTADQILMKEVLVTKGNQVLHSLIDSLSSKNNDDLEKTLNAYTVLMEFCENDHCFSLLLEDSVLKKVIGVACQGDANVQNAPYALNVLSTIIQQFGEDGREMLREKREGFQTTLSNYFMDLAYSCILTLRQGDPLTAANDTYVNQSGHKIAKIGIRRIRAMELLKTLMVALSKNFDIKDPKVLTECLRCKVIDTMLFMIKTFPFCSTSHQQAIMILNSLKEAFDAEDVFVLKQFVQRELDASKEFAYPSSRTTSGMNMGQITQIAFELRNITQAALDDESSSAEEDLEDQVSIQKRREMGEWFKFCKNKIEKIEKVWNRKLEDSTEDDEEEEIKD